MKFDEFFGQIYGGRWAVLREALLSSEGGKVLLQNPLGRENYSLDEASTFAARALDVRTGDRVADFCSAPGGKLLTLIFDCVKAGIFEQVNFIANDLSPARVARLKAVLHDCLPPEMVARIDVRRGDAALWGKRWTGAFDKVLLDAPCSGEAHLLRSPRELERWSAKGSKRLSVRQHALLCSALDCLAPGGRLVYSTCTISPVENDGVIARLHESREGKFQVVLSPAGLAPESEAYRLGEDTRFGKIFLPDRAGCGPIFYGIIEKL